MADRWMLVETDMESSDRQTDVPCFPGQLGSSAPRLRRPGPGPVHKCAKEKTGSPTARGRAPRRPPPACLPRTVEPQHAARPSGSSLGGSRAVSRPRWVPGPPPSTRAPLGPPALGVPLLSLSRARAPGQAADQPEKACEGPRFGPAPPHPRGSGPAPSEGTGRPRSPAGPGFQASFPAAPQPCPLPAGCTNVLSM